MKEVIERLLNELLTCEYKHTQDPDTEAFKKAYEQQKEKVKQCILGFNANDLPAVVAVKDSRYYFRKLDCALLTILMQHYSAEEVIEFIEHGVPTAPKTSPEDEETVIYNERPLEYAISLLVPLQPHIAQSGLDERQFHGLKLAHYLVIKCGVKYRISEDFQQLEFCLSKYYKDDITEPTETDTLLNQLLNAALPDMNLLSPSTISRRGRSTYNIFHAVSSDNTAFMEQAIQEFRRRYARDAEDLDNYGYDDVEVDNMGEYQTVRKPLCSKESLALCLNERNSDSEPQTPLAIAVSIGNMKAVELFLEAGAKPLIFPARLRALLYNEKPVLDTQLFFDAHNFDTQNAPGRMLRLLLDSAVDVIRSQPNNLLGVVLRKKSKSLFIETCNYYQENGIDADFNELLEKAVELRCLPISMHILQECLASPPDNLPQILSELLTIAPNSPEDYLNNLQAIEAYLSGIDLDSFDLTDFSFTIHVRDDYLTADTEAIIKKLIARFPDAELKIASGYEESRVAEPLHQHVPGICERSVTFKGEDFQPTLRTLLEAEAAEHARLEAEAAEHARLEAEAAERTRLEAEAAERTRLETEAEQTRLEAEAEQAPAVVIPAHYDGDDTQASDNPKPSMFGALARMGSIGAGLAMSGIAIAAGATIIALALSAPHVLVALATTALVVKTATLIGVSVHSAIIGLGAAITTVGVAMGLGVAGISKHHSQAVTDDFQLVASQIGSGIRCAVSCAPCASTQRSDMYEPVPQP